MNTVEKECIIEFEEKKSKFIGYIKPISTKKEAEDFIKSIKIKHNNATHNVPVYRVIDNGKEYFKFDDDGEPSGTAGKPMAEIINLKEIYNVVIVATRYFGGIKLGAGGLVRNYAKTAKLAIEEAKIIEYIEKVEIIIDFPYNISGEIDRIIISNDIEILEKTYDARITFKIRVDKVKESLFNNIKDVIVIK
ncbi:putative YigZ family protein [Hypnocyclicus thermotrophus]|uniref:YigZ family protein n=1 Tax=Hypnocyclicus thermotrophus TaxID=1627895 RepID=A0AA46DXI7_9FUSO|nr:YigZ family protein [Hypnocyclicus thermotrophus]TDT67895.1 putative YigZ family protein [Hypnocyclicus thermotrophus]